MQKITIEIDDNQTPIIHTVPTADYEDVANAMASMVPSDQIAVVDVDGKPVLDSNNDPTMREMTIVEKVTHRISAWVNKDLLVWGKSNNPSQVKTVTVKRIEIESA